jgi:hypothetical protein
LNPFDPSVLEAIHGQIRVSGPPKYTRHTVNLKTARALVDAKVAYVEDRHRIRMIYSKKEFNSIILFRDNFICHYCGSYGDTVDHVIPKSKGGLRTFDNCVCACKSCNECKGSNLVDRASLHLLP